jgi:hypothetical protein
LAQDPSFLSAIVASFEKIEIAVRVVFLADVLALFAVAAAMMVVARHFTGSRRRYQSTP